MTQHVCSCHCGSNLFYKHLHAESCALSWREHVAVLKACEQTALDRVADLTAKLKAKDSALEFAKAAIGDAIYLEDGLDGETGQRVQRLIVEALERGTCDAPGDIADFLTTRERVTQDQITDLTAKLEAQNAEIRDMRKSIDTAAKGIVRLTTERDDLTRRLEEAQHKYQCMAEQWGLAVDLYKRRERQLDAANEVNKNRLDDLNALQAKLAAAEQERDTMRPALLALPVVTGNISVGQQYTMPECAHYWAITDEGSFEMNFAEKGHAESYAALLRLAQAMRGK